MIAPALCPALDILRADPVGPGDPRIKMPSLEVSPAKPLAGEVSNLGGRVVTLLISTNDGAIVRIEAARDPGGDKATFSQPLTPDAKSAKTLQMLLAIVSPKPLKALEGFRAGSTADIAPKIVAELSAAGGNVEAEFFRVGN